MVKDVRKFGFSDKRGRASTNEDPYFSAESLKEGSFCSDCHALYKNKSWSLDPEAFEQAKSGKGQNWTICPACRKIAAHYAEGVMSLRGEYLWKHEKEIRNILKNEESRAMEKNPLERIMSIERQGDALIIETTEEKLAEHLGRTLHRSHQGSLKVRWSSDPTVCRVNWER